MDAVDRQERAAADRRAGVGVVGQAQPDRSSVDAADADLDRRVDAGEDRGADQREAGVCRLALNSARPEGPEPDGGPERRGRAGPGRPGRPGGQRPAARVVRRRARLRSSRSASRDHEGSPGRLPSTVSAAPAPGTNPPAVETPRAGEVSRPSPVTPPDDTPDDRSASEPPAPGRRPTRRAARRRSRRAWPRRGPRRAWPGPCCPSVARRPRPCAASGRVDGGLVAAGLARRPAAGTCSRSTSWLTRRISSSWLTDVGVRVDADDLLVALLQRVLVLRRRPRRSRP